MPAYGQLSTKLNRAYCVKHGYDFEIFDHQRTYAHLEALGDKVQTVSPYWLCMMDMYYLLCSDAHKKYDYFMFMDLDAIFHSPELSIWDIIDQFPDREVIIGQDTEQGFDRIGSIVNTGSFIVKNTDWTKSFFKLIWERYMYADGTVGSVGARWSKGDDGQWN
jgi:hypothetical protein